MPVFYPDRDDPVNPQISQKPETNEITVTHGYHSAVNAVTRPESTVALSQYFVDRWMPLVGPNGTAIVLALRREGYYNRKTGERRDEITMSRSQLASRAGISVDTLDRELGCIRVKGVDPKDWRITNPSLRLFVQPRRRVRRDALGRVRQEDSAYWVSMDDPLHPDDWPLVEKAADEAARRLDKSPERQNAVPVDGGPKTPEPQNTAPVHPEPQNATPMPQNAEPVPHYAEPEPRNAVRLKTDSSLPFDTFTNKTTDKEIVVGCSFDPLRAQEQAQGIQGSLEALWDDHGTGSVPGAGQPFPGDDGPDASPAMNETRSPAPANYVTSSGISPCPSVQSPAEDPAFTLAAERLRVQLGCNAAATIAKMRAAGDSDQTIESILTAALAVTLSAGKGAGFAIQTIRNMSVQHRAVRERAATAPPAASPAPLDNPAPPRRPGPDKAEEFTCDQKADIKAKMDAMSEPDLNILRAEAISLTKPDFRPSKKRPEGSKLVIKANMERIVAERLGLMVDQSWKVTSLAPLHPSDEHLKEEVKDSHVDYRRIWEELCADEKALWLAKGTGKSDEATVSRAIDLFITAKRAEYEETQ